MVNPKPTTTWSEFDEPSPAFPRPLVLPSPLPPAQLHRVQRINRFADEEQSFDLLGGWVDILRAWQKDVDYGMDPGVVHALYGERTA